MSDLPISDLTERQARLFAADCAERALSRVESPDPRSVAAVQAARDFAEGRIDSDALEAARDAAWFAVRDAENVAERAAAWAATWFAPRTAATSAANAAAWTPERAAERDAEREWQAQRIDYYRNGEAAS